MGKITSLSGRIRLSPRALARLFAIEGLGWSWDDQTIDDYLRGGYHYEGESQTLVIDTSHKMYHNPDFFNLVAHFKDIDSVDFLCHGGEHDASNQRNYWGRLGGYNVAFFRCGSWAAAELPDSTIQAAWAFGVQAPHDLAWFNAIPPVRQVDFDPATVSLVLTLDSGKQAMVPTGSFDELALLAPEALGAGVVVGGGLAVRWASPDSGDAELLLTTDRLLKLAVEA